MTRQFTAAQVTAHNARIRKGIAAVVAGLKKPVKKRLVMEYVPLTPVEIYLRIPTVSEANKREHWAAKAKRVKSQRSTAKFETQDLLMLKMPLSVTLTRVSPRPLDDDNLRGALKAVRDGIADRLGINDRDPRVAWLYSQRRGKKGEQAVEVGAVTV